jgi:hypothetical protein
MNMRQTTLPIPELGAIAATRGMLGAGAALLLADRFPSDKWKKLGWLLFAAGAVTTVPFLIDVVKKTQSQPDSSNRRPKTKN